MPFDPTTAREVAPATVNGFDPTTARDFAPEGAPQPANPSFLDKALEVLGRVGDDIWTGPAETAAHVVSSAAGGLGGGLTYLGTLAATGGNTEAAKAVQEATQGAMTYQPRTKGGKDIANAVDAALAKIPKALDSAGGYVTDKTGSPLMGTAVNVGGNALLQAFGARGMLRAPVAAGADAAGAGAASTALDSLGRPPLSADTLTPAQLRAQSIANAERVGYQATPNYNPASSALDRLGQGIAGKANVEQAARVQNQGVTNALGAKAIGLDPRQAITKAALNTIRDQAAKDGYAPIENLDGVIPSDSQFLLGIAKTKQNSANPLSGNPDVGATADLLQRSYFEPSEILDQVQTLRNRAQDAFDSGRKSAANGFKAQAAELESLLDRHLQDADEVSQGMLDKYRAARQLISKTYDIEGSLNPSTGDIDASAIGKLLADGKPLTEELKLIADFANAAPGIAGVPKGVPLPTSPLNTAAGVMTAHATHGASLALLPAIRMGAAKWLLRRNEDPSLLQPAGKTFAQSALDAIHGSSPAFTKFYGPAAAAAVPQTDSSEANDDN